MDSKIIVIGLFVNLFRNYQRTRELDGMDLLFIIAIIVMALPFKYQPLNLSPPPKIFLAYPKLNAGITVLIYFFYVMNRIRFSPRRSFE